LRKTLPKRAIPARTEYDVGEGTLPPGSIGPLYRAIIKRAFGLTLTRSDLLAELDRKEEGGAALNDLLAERPSDATVLNALCWFRGVWNYAVAEGPAQCNRALEASSWSPGVLDSRAMVGLRHRKLDGALADANAVLGRSPGQTQTLLLRGVIRKRMGDTAGGAADLADALRRQPGLAREYRLYGVLP
jgi:hypothetical protein